MKSSTTSQNKSIHNLYIPDEFGILSEASNACLNVNELKETISMRTVKGLLAASILAAARAAPSSARRQSGAKPRCSHTMWYRAV